MNAKQSTSLYVSQKAAFQWECDRTVFEQKAGRKRRNVCPDCTECPAAFFGALGQLHPACHQCPGLMDLACLLDSPWFADPDLLSLVAEQHGLDLWSTVVMLADKWGIDVDNPWDDLPERYKKMVGDSRALRNPDLSFIPNAAGRVLIPFIGPAGTPLGFLVVQLNADGTKSLLPYTAYSDPQSTVHFGFHVPFSGKFPLFNWNLIHANPDAEVVLVDSPDLAMWLSQSEPFSNRIYSSWPGGIDTVNRVQWEILSNRAVTYGLFPRESFPALKAYETALHALPELMKAPGLLLRIQEMASAGDTVPVNTMSMLVDEFLERAISEYGLGRLAIKVRLSGKKESKFVRMNAMADLPYPKFVVPPYICEGDLCILFAKKGVGKSIISLRMAEAVALGKQFLEVFGDCPQATVLYVDGETGATGMGSRRNHMLRTFGLGRHISEPLWLYSDRLDLYSEEGRRKIEQKIADIEAADPDAPPLKLIVFDNLTSMNGGKDTPNGWDDFYTWTMSLKAQGIACLVVYHANDDESLRGSKMKLVNADDVLLVKELITDEETGDIVPAPKNAKGGKVSEDRDELWFRLQPKNLRNNPFPDAYKQVDISFSVADAKWEMMNGYGYVRNVLENQVRYGMTDEEMAIFWGKTPRQIRELRRDFCLKKYDNTKLAWMQRPAHPPKPGGTDS